MILTLLIIPIWLIMHFGIGRKEGHNAKWVLYMLCGMLGVISLSIIISFLGILKVKINVSSKELVFSRIFSQSILQSSEIEGYYISVYKTKGGTAQGRIIRTKSNRFLEFNPGNLDDLKPLNEYLNDLPIEYYGEKRSFYPFTAGL